MSEGVSADGRVSQTVVVVTIVVLSELIIVHVSFCFCRTCSKR